MNRRAACKIPFLLVTGLLLLSATALAAWNMKGSTVNYLSVPAYKNTIVEEYRMPEHVDPGQKVEKKVTVRNEGTVDTFVRVKVSKAFGTYGEGGSFIRDETLNPEMIIITYNEEDWKLLPDGYWYYGDVLLAGETAQGPLMKYYRLSEKADNRYKNKEAQIVVTMESIQAAGGVMETVWGHKEKELGILYQPCLCETVTRVSVTEDRRIVFEGDEGNLFADFQNLLPGCARTQTIRVENKSGTDISLALRAEAAKQNKMSGKEKELVSKLLSKYAQIEIKEKNTVLYQGSVDGNLKGKGWTMKDNLPLGSFAAGEGRNLLVKLSVSPEMDTQYQKLMGKVKWVFTASGKEAEQTGGNGGRPEREPESGTPARTKQTEATGVISPKTGDDTSIWKELFLLCCGFVGAAASCRRIYGGKKK